MNLKTESLWRNQLSWVSAHCSLPHCPSGSLAKGSFGLSLSKNADNFKRCVSVGRSERESEGHFPTQSFVGDHTKC